MIVKYKATYFKSTGKYYTEAEGECEAEFYHDISPAIKQQRRERKLPGVTSGQGFFIVVEPLSPEEYNIPFLIHPAEL